MVPILISKDVFEPSYNDLKFMVWNCNYFCTNLIISRVTVILSIIRPIQNSKVPPWFLPTMSPLSKFFLDYILFYTLLYLLLLTEASVSPCLMRSKDLPQNWQNYGWDLQCQILLQRENNCRKKSKVYHCNYKHRDIPWWIVLLMCIKNKNSGQHFGQHLFHLSWLCCL